ncbi:hypothetical protein [Streptomyces canus]|uniref:hypothetical protein n=1 Tax=Streptomyces canus TaxID=58343 RepID=UPI002E2668D9
MPLVLTQGAVLQCSHGGQLKPDCPGDSNVTVKQRGVLTSGAEAGLTFGAAEAPVPGMVVPCPAKTPTGTPQPCVTTPTTPVGLAVKFTVGGKPALLATAIGITASGLGPGTWSVADPGQTLLEAI